MKHTKESKIDGLEKILNYKFRDLKLLEMALTHSSYANELKEKACENNERLEFLGDAVLELIISHYIYKHFPELPEGELTKLRASIVCESTLAKKSQALKFGLYLKLGKGEEATGGRNRDSILADLFEAILGAIYLDGGFSQAEQYIHRILDQEIENLSLTFNQNDSKTYLQEIIQRESKEPLLYRIIDEKGPEHEKEFVAEVSHMGSVLGTGIGKSKKEAEQNAAAKAVKNFSS